MSHERAATSEEALARFAATIELESLPSPVIQKLKALILDSIGVSLAGAGAPGVDPVVRAVRGWGGTPESTVFAHGMRVAAPFAALANGVMATARDFDDTLDDAMLASRVTIHRDPEISDPVTFVPQSVAIRLRDGRRYARTIDTLKGHPSRPLTDAERLTKFQDCCAFCPRPLSDRRSAAIVDAVMHLDEITDLSEFGRLLALDEGG